MHRVVGVLASLALVAGVLAAPPAHAKVGCGPADLEYIYLKTFKVEVKLPKGPFEPGDTVPLPTLVTRPADEDPLDQGIPTPRPVVLPADAVPVVVVAFGDDVLLIDFKSTNAEGKVNLALKLPSYMPAGPVAARFYAQKLLLDLNCIIIYEIGEVQFSRAFVVKG